MSRKGELSRERMLQAIKALVMRKGFAGTSVDDVLREAGVSKGAFLHHFKSKPDLAEQLVRWRAGLDMKMFRSFIAETEAAMTTRWIS